MPDSSDPQKNFTGLNSSSFRATELDQTMDTAGWVTARGDELRGALMEMAHQRGYARDAARVIFSEAFEHPLDRIRHLELTETQLIRQRDRIEGALALCHVLSNRGIGYPRPTTIETWLRALVVRGRLSQRWLERYWKLDMRLRKYR